MKSITLAASRLVAPAMLCLLAATPNAARAVDYSDMIIDVNSGTILHETNADGRRFPASLTKMMTLYVVFDMIEKHRLSLDTELTISDYDASAQPSKLGLKTGEKIVLSDAIKALVTASANDVARAIAENLAGDEEKFARYMTWQAHRLGMKNTTFRNASGLPDSEQMTTARDFVTLSLRLYDDFPQHFKVFKTTYFSYGRARYRNHNGLLFNFQGSDGIKTGYIKASGFNLAASVRRGGKHVIGVIFGGRSVGDRNAKMRNLLTAALGRAATQRTRPPGKSEPRIAVNVARDKGKAKSERLAIATALATVAKPKAKVALGSMIGRTSLQPDAKTADPSAASATESDAPTSVAKLAADGPFHVQIGAYASEAEARQKLGVVLVTAGKVLAGHAPMAVVYNTASRVWYRARFAGFDRPAADQTCLALKSKQFECIVMRSN